MDNTKIITFEETISTYTIYTNTTKQFYQIISADENAVPVLDLRNTKYIVSSAVPVLLSFGDYLSRLRQRPIPIVISFGSDLHSFIMHSKFYEISSNLGIFQWEDGIENGYYSNGYREFHKISYTGLRYTDAEEISDLSLRRNYIFDCLLDRSKVIYRNVLTDTNRLPENVVYSTMKSIAEIETNAIMYSGSHSFTYLASDRYGTKLSVADSGQGFEKSFLQDNKRLDYLEEKLYDTKKFKNYLVIMSVLNYSYKKHMRDERENLWTLKRDIAEQGDGIFKIQYDNTQVIFSSNRCKYCTNYLDNEGLRECTRCLMDDYSDSQYSPIKISSIGFQGVRVEAIIDRGV